MTKLYSLSYHEVQIAGFRNFISYETALKEFLRHCILETKSVLNSSSDEEAEEERSTENDFDEMTCVFEIQELESDEYVTTKEYDYETFQMFIEDIDNIDDYLNELEKKLDAGEIPEDLKEIFSEWIK